MNYFRTFALLLLIVCPLVSMAGIVPVPQGKIYTPTNGSPVVTVGTATAEAQVIMPAPSYPQYVDRYKLGVITFGVDHHYGQVFPSSRIEIKVKVQRYTTLSSGTPLADTVLNLAVSYSPNDSLTFEDRHSISFFNLEKYTMILEEILVDGTLVNDLPANLYIHGDLFIDRIYDFVPYVQNVPVITETTEDIDFDNYDDQIKLSWNSIPGAQEYQLEWTYINNYGDVVGTTIPANQLAVDFKHNSSRVSTTNTNYTVSLAFDRGYVCYRVRAVGRSNVSGEMNKLIFGVWSTNQDEVAVDLVDHFEIVTPFEVNKNWQYSTTYAEEGKKKEVVSFFDGSLRNRQMVTKINSDNNAIVGETIYDHQGRPVIQVLPTPVEDPVGGNGVGESSLKYYENFTQNENGAAYSRNDFDLSPSNDPCEIETAGMGTAIGASNYYSGANNNLDDSQGYLPDAENYPFSQIEYTPDNTGRVRRQSGVGEDFKLGSGHESNYFYSHPFQFQLDRMFGSEVGDASHYQKNMVIDPNGQVSVSYLDQEGRVIATSLAGVAPENVLGLLSASNPQEMIVDLFAKDDDGVSLTNELTIEQNATYFNQTISLSSPSDLEFDYTLSIDPFTDECFSNICFTCVYDLEIEVRNDCGVLLSDGNLSSKKAGRFQLNAQTNEVEFYLDCPANANFVQNEPFTIPAVPTGTYHVTKKLTVNEEALSFYLNAYLDSTLNTCFTTLYETTLDYLENTDFTDCDENQNCEACLTELGSLDLYISEGRGSQEDYELEVAACNAPCEPISFCEVQKEFLLSDMRPGGQYAQYENLTGGIQPSNFVLSVFNTSNLLPISMGGGSANWKNPVMLVNGQFVNEYREDDLVTRSRIAVAVTFLGVTNTIASTSPQIQNPVLGVNVFEDPISGQYYSWPEELVNVADFIFAYQAKGSWANSLLFYHPEYSYYKTCLEFTVPIQPNDEFTSESFDQQMQQITTWDDAVAAGFIKPNWLSINNVNNRLRDFFDPSLTVWDPFGVYFISNFGGQVNELEEKMMNYQSINNVNYSIMEFAAIITRCGNASIGTQPNATCTRFGDDVQVGNAALNEQTRNDEWMMFRGLYLSIKQELQFKLAQERALTDANFYGYNGCIGNTAFNPTLHGFLSFPNMQGSQFFNPIQPCSFFTNYAYQNKDIRFFSPAEQYATTPNQAAYLTYLLTGECPVIQALQTSLNEVAVTEQLALASFQFSDLATFSGLELTLNDFVAQSPLPTVTWNQLSSTPQALDIELNETSSIYGTISLQKLPLEPLVFDWIDVVGFHSMHFTTTSGSLFNFTIKAEVETINGTVTVDLTGQTSFDLKQCRFEEECIANELGQDIELLIQTVAGTGQFTAASLQLQGVANPYDYTVTNKIQYAASDNLTSSMFWSYDVALPGFNLYETNLNERLALKINSVEPATFNLANLSSVASVSEVLIGQNSTFSIVCNDAAGNYLVTLKCDAIYHVNGQMEQVPFGECDLPTPLTCIGVEFENTEDLFDVFSDVLVNQNAPYDLMASANYSSGLTAQFPVNTTQIVGTISTVGTMDVLEFDVPDGCPITLSIDTDQTNGASFSSIISINDIQLTGSTNNFGTYNSFELEVTFDYNGSVFNELISGQTCLPLQICEGCLDSVELIDYTPQELEAISTLQLQQGIVRQDASVANYELYQTEIAALNTRLGWLPTDTLFVEGVDYTYFFKNGISYPITSYIDYLQNYDTLIDNYAYLLDPIAFILDYGHARNVSKEYERYLIAVNNYNAIRLNASLTTIVPVDDTAFAITRYVDTLNQYIAYLNTNIGDSAAALNINAFPDAQAASIGDGICQDLYAEYVLAYQSFRLAQLASSTCLNYQIVSPFVSYQVFVDNNLCCSADGFTALQNYIDSFYDTLSCPGEVPFKESCVTPIELNPKDCQKGWSKYKKIINQFNNSVWAQLNNQQLVLLYPNFNSFVQTGKCDCVQDYIAYLTPYVLATDGSLPGPVLTIDEFCPSEPLVPENSPCENAYDEYLDCIATYNEWAIESSEAVITLIVRIEEFYAQDLCSCVDAYCATLNAIMNGFTQSDRLPDLITVCAVSTRPPCTPNLPLVTNVELPSAEFIDPCMEFYTNNAQYNALNAYNQYVQELTTEFSQRYVEHCMTATEDFSLKFYEIEHHFTLYYYDQAGNLIKTVPPEGVEMLDVADPVIQSSILADRANGTHTILTSHRLATTYQYNSLNQLVSQSTPDQDKMDIFEITLPNGLSSRLKTTSIQMISANVGYLTGFVNNPNAPLAKRGYLYRTENGGTNWQRMNYTLAANLHSVKMVTDILGFAIGEGGILLKTSDGGVSWDLMNTYASGVISPITAIDVESTSLVLAASKNGNLISISGANLDVLTFGLLSVPGGVGTIVDVHSLLALSSSDFLALITLENAGVSYDAVLNRTAGTYSFEAINEGDLSAISILNSTDILIGGADGNLVFANGNATSNYAQQMKTSSLLGTIENIYYLSALRSAVVVNENSVKKLYYSLDGSETWVPVALTTLNPTVSLIRHTSSEIELLLTDAVSVNKFVLSSTLNPYVVDQTSNATPPGDFVATSSVKVGQNWHYFGVKADGTVYRSNPLPSSATLVTFSQIYALPSLVAKKIEIEKLTSGEIYMSILTNTGTMKKLVSPSISGTYTLASIDPPAGVTNAHYVDFAFASLSGVTYLIAYDNQNNQVGRKLIQATATNETFDLVSLNMSSTTPAVGEISAIAFRNNKIRVVGLKGSFYTSSNLSETSTSLDFHARKDMRSTPLNQLKKINGTIVVVGNNGRVLQRVTSGSNNIWETSPVNVVANLNAVSALSNAAIIAGDNATLFSLDLTNLAKAGFISNTGIAIETAANGVNFNGLETIQNQTYVVGDNGTLLYSDDANASAFGIAPVLTPKNFNSVCVVPAQTGMQQRVIVVGDEARVYRYKGVTGTETKEVFGAPYTDVHFANSQLGSIVGEHYTVRTTSNGGVTWSIELPPLGSIASTNINSINKVWTVPTANGNHFAVLGGNNYCAGVRAHLITDVPHNQVIRDIQFSSNSPLNGFIASSAFLRKIELTAVNDDFTITIENPGINAGTGIRAIHVFENQTVMAVGNDLISYFDGATFQNALNGEIGNFRDVYFHDNTEGTIVGLDGKYLSVQSTDNAPLTHQIIVGGLQYTQKTLLDGIIGANTDVDILAIAFGSPIKGIWGGDFIGNTYNSQPIPYVRLINDESNEISARFFYDRLGRIVVSQNSRQAANVINGGAKYSYSLYDPLGRVVEAGEKTENAGAVIQFDDILGTYVNGLFVSSVIDDANLESWLIAQSTTTRKEVTKSFYDVSHPQILAQFPAGFLPDELTQRKRIVHVTYEEEYDNDDATYNHATHYDYDIHGNVKTLLQENTQISTITDIAQHRFKRLDYNYDLISGNVHRVDYQTGNADQWHHAYEYDADNRITDVYTSITTPLLDPNLGQAAAQNEPTLTPYWDKEASYAYYEHGPLARTELGAQKVQGVDYVYTLQGWIKGVNSNNLDPENDPGKDGLGLSANHHVARDVFGFSLHYFQGDYTCVIPANEDFMAQQTNSDLVANSSDLYNGNIGRMVTTITHPDTREVLPLGNAYKYDQLQRLKEANSFNNMNVAGNAFGTGGTPIYQNAFTYDANGNITHQLRKDESGATIDDLEYRYNDLASKRIQNRLYHVNETVGNGAYGDDIDDMGAFVTTNINQNNNYAYDQEGRLIKDVQEEIESIIWRVDGKVKKIVRPANSQKKNVSFDYDAMGNRIAKHVMNAQNQLEKSTYYVLDAQGNTMSVYERAVDAGNQSVTFEQAEKHIFGSSRLGVMNVKVALLGTQNITYSMVNKKHVSGQRTYELSNHLGNVLTVITDKKLPHSTNGTTVDYYTADVISATDYYPFGSPMPGRTFVSDSYRYGYQGSEKTDEIKGSGNHYTTFFRELDPRLGRWWATDPVVHPWQSPYCSMDNNPIRHNDRLGNDVGYGSKKDERRVNRKAFFNKEFRAEHQARVNSSELHVYMQADNKPNLKDAQSEFKWTNDFGQVENWVEYSRSGLGGFGGGGWDLPTPQIDITTTRKIKEVERDGRLEVPRQSDGSNPAQGPFTFNSPRNWVPGTDVSFLAKPHPDQFTFTDQNGQIIPFTDPNTGQSYNGSFTIVSGGIPLQNVQTINKVTAPGIATQLVASWSITVMSQRRFTPQNSGDTFRPPHDNKDVFSIRYSRYYGLPKIQISITWK